MTNIRENKELGDSGERIAINLLKQSLHCNTSEPKPDLGIDIIIEFKSPDPNKHLLHLGVQVKAGFSYCKDLKNRFKIKKINRNTITNWHSSKLPILLVWVNPDEENGAYWHLFDSANPSRQIVIPKSRKITPATKFDIARKLLSWDQQSLKKPAKLFAPPLSSGIRQAAKILYKSLKETRQPINPLLGQVNITWRGWRHITSQKRKATDIYQSLQLLPVLKYVIENPLPNPKLGRRQRIHLGNWCHEVRLLVFRIDVPLKRRTNAKIECVLRETIKYPKNWHSVAASKIERRVAFESISEIK